MRFSLVLEGYPFRAVIVGIAYGWAPVVVGRDTRTVWHALAPLISFLKTLESHSSRFALLGCGRTGPLMMITPSLLILLIRRASNPPPCRRRQLEVLISEGARWE